MKPPYTERYVRWWCAMQGIQVMREGPSVGIEQANLPNNPNAATIHSCGSERLGKRLQESSHV